ncbi:hypothetical protein A4D02_24615 [Niastella koreensis]|uniref:Uncharacterized protein n=1 Tax=Niastella koreensis TaxID=354356 RepID=A0ABX3P0U9_9BACT|nr:hypothetical protein A4D02_24615 [Niastella koreensis]
MWSGFHEAVKISLLRQNLHLPRRLADSGASGRRQASFAKASAAKKKDRLPVNRDDPFFEIPTSAYRLIGAVCLLINETLN